MNKVFEGTPRFGQQSKCITCRNAVRMTNIEGTMVFCHAVEIVGHVKQPVLECTAYDDKRHAAYAQMRQAAWILRTDASGEKIGFVSPKEWAKLQKEKIKQGEQLD